MSDCIFCKIVAGDVPANKVHEDDDVLAIMDVGHVNPGHCLVIVKSHVPTIMELDDAKVGNAFTVASQIARALESNYHPDGMTILQANRPAGWQTVPHFHVHILPRHADDGVGLTWPAKNPPQEELAATAANVRAALAG